MQKQQPNPQSTYLRTGVQYLKIYCGQGLPQNRCAILKDLLWTRPTSEHACNILKSVADIAYLRTCMQYLKICC